MPSISLIALLINLWWEPMTFIIIKLDITVMNPISIVSTNPNFFSQRWVSLIASDSGNLRAEIRYNTFYKHIIWAKTYQCDKFILNPHSSSIKIYDFIYKSLNIRNIHVQLIELLVLPSLIYHKSQGDVYLLLKLLHHLPFFWYQL